MGQEIPGAHRHITPVAEADLDPQLQWLVAYWAGKRAGRRYPSRADIDPLELKSLLGHILLVDVERRDHGTLPRFRYRLFGTEFVFYHGKDLTGHWLDEIANREFRDELLAIYRSVAERGKMRTLSYDYMVESQRHRFQAVLLPLSGDGTLVDIVLGCGVRVAVI
ncbi:MAG: PAS domain-containing protein [Ferrovibrio sp.]|uniref:PAS domain-containing protein n=1 Tax=Ferrovibrio sp. TaxID=1917215 RepID=UPI003919C78E